MILVIDKIGFVMVDVVGNDTSGLKGYSLGIVVEDKPLTSKIITVCPIELLPGYSGKLSDTTELIANVTDAHGARVGASSNKAVVIKAKWLPIGNSNRSTPPDVIKNETVRLYRFFDDDDIYWTTLFNEPTIRRRETVLYTWGNEGQYGVPLGLDNSYWFLVSSHHKTVHLHISDNDGEFTTYDVTFDTKKGNFTFNDGIKNSISLDSPKSTLNVNINTEIVFTTKTFKVKAKHIILEADNIDIKGKTKISGPLTVTDNVTMNKSLSVSDNVRAGKSVKAPDCC